DPEDPARLFRVLDLTARRDRLARRLAHGIRLPVSLHIPSSRSGQTYFGSRRPRASTAPPTVWAAVSPTVSTTWPTSVTVSVTAGTVVSSVSATGWATGVAVSVSGGAAAAAAGAPSAPPAGAVGRGDGLAARAPREPRR